LDSFSIVFLCTGNRFRSPLAAACLRRLTLGLPVEVASRGSLRLNGSGALPEALELALWLGVDLSPHRAEQLDPSSLRGLDLLVGFEQGHVRHAVIDCGFPRERAFAINELVASLQDCRALADDIVQRARLAVAHAHENRGQVPRSPDIPDPFGRPWKVQCRIAAEIRDASIQLASSLFGVTNTMGLPSLPEKVPRRRRALRGASTADA
jgi:protein-tyrosine-phosphatase